MKFQVGDRVSFLNEVGGGKVVEVISDFTIRVLADDGFEYHMPVKQLVIEREVPYGPIRQKDKPEGPPQKNSKARLNDEVLEVDLHIHELLDDHRHMTNWEVVQYQLRVCEQKLYEAMRKKIGRVILIHGVGEGVLKEEVRALLRKKYPELEHDDASFKKYGRGATEVRLKGK